MDGHPLKALLQLQLGSDSYAVLHLPYTLASLTAESLLPSPHSSKWTARINSLLHSKAPDARWAGLCLAQKTSVLSKSTMIECAQSWIGIVLPVLSKKESPPILSASVRLLRVIFSAAADVPEFQRQVATPNVLKFTTALISLAEKHVDTELKILALSTLALIIPLYPTLHRASHSALSALCLGFLNGNPFKPPNVALTRTASRLYMVLHFTGGKVGAANLWRKSVDDTLAFGWTSFLSVRSTFLVEGRVPQLPAATEEPLVSIPLNVDRLRTTTHRPVQVPLGPLTKFAMALLSFGGNIFFSSPSEQLQVDRHIDPGVRAMEAAVTPQIWKLACDLITCLATCVQHHLSSSQARIVTCIAFHLEHHLTSSERLPFLNTLQVVLAKCHPLHSTLVVNRLARAIVPLLSVVLAKEPDARESDGTAQGRSKKSKKRAREFEGDEVFKISREVVCPTVDEGNALLAAFAAIRLVLQNPNLSPAMQSISCRVVLSVLLVLPEMSPGSLSADPKLHPLLLQRVQALSVELGAGSTRGMSKSLGLVVGANLADSHLHRDLEVLLHPRLPPLVRSMPYVESLSVFRAEESQEESEMRQSLGLVPAETEDVVMAVANPPAPPTPPRTSKNLPVPPSVAVPAAVQLPPQPLPQLPPKPSLPDDGERIEAAKAPVPSPTPAKAIDATPVQVEMPIFVEEEEKNEEMPAIDLGSDSDSDL
ncbi:rRNA processing/ribosome biogenesis-domain-containing protein [Mycena albidolilacea]|uniref:Pre-rRNA-processing protein RIX1 n=1 Tax=Mycena albidolilacea TaxID=1033008 RepID=A0AAD7F4P1_9AGAR|nr:rRNA processing/ribosome biogenesis-domain-containing protein [Mycena albidolilacea]